MIKFLEEVTWHKHCSTLHTNTNVYGQREDLTPLLWTGIYCIQYWKFFSFLECVIYQNIKCKYKILFCCLSQHNNKCGVTGYEVRWRFDMTADFRKRFEYWITYCMDDSFKIPLKYVEVLWLYSCKRNSRNWSSVPGDSQRICISALILT